MKNRRLTEERGVYLWIIAVLAVVMISLLGLVMGVNYITNGLSKYQEVSDLAAASALNEFIRADADDTYADRADQALLGANRVLAQNNIIGLGALNGVIHPNGSASNPQGTLELGTWYESAPPGTCPGDRERCFEPNVAPATGVDALVNAVRLRVNNDTASNPLISPLCNLLYGGGGCSQGLQAESTITVIPRCMAFLLDVSGSVHITTHKIDFQLARRGTDPIWNNIEHCVNRNLGNCLFSPGDDQPSPNGQKYPATYPAAPVIRYQATLHPITKMPLTPADCTDRNSYLDQESVIWCNMLTAPENLGDPIDSIRPAGVPPIPFDPTRHYWSDYVRRTVVYDDGTAEDFLVDALVVPGLDYSGPQPFAGLLLGGNAGFRAIQATLTTSDLGRIQNFSGKVTGSFPLNSAADKMTSNFGALVQITNFENIGTILGIESGAQVPNSDQVRPNFMDVTAFSPPTWGDPFASHTNALIALEDAMQALSDCPANSRKLIFLATDMISSCTRKSGVAAGSISPSDYTCNKNYAGSFQAAESQLLDEAGNLISRLRENKISVTVLQAGEYLGMNYRNEKNAEGEYIDFLEAGARGMIKRYSQPGYSCPSGSDSFFDLCPSCPTGTPVCDQNTAHNNAGRPGFAFKEPIGIAADLALQTGGIYCPLMRTCNPSTDYDNATGELLEECRDGTRDCDGDGNAAVQSCSARKLSIGAQAAKCVLDALTGDPFKLVIEDTP